MIRTQRPSVEDKGEGALVRIVAPVTNRGDAIGLLELFLPAAPDAEVMREIGETAHALAYIVIANRSYTDVYQWGRRTIPLSLAAEFSTGCSRRRWRVRRRSSRWPGHWSPPTTSGATPSTT